MSEVWEEVTQDYKTGGDTYRMKVPGGWLYKVRDYTYLCDSNGMTNAHSTISTTFVPDLDAWGYRLYEVLRQAR